MCGRHVTHTVITGHKHAFYRKYMDRRNEPLPRLYRKYAQMMHTMPLSERGKKFREKIPLFSCQGRICTFFVSVAVNCTHTTAKESKIMLSLENQTSSCISIFAKDAHYATEWAWERVTGVKILVSRRTLFCVKWSGKKMLCTHTNLYFWENYFFVSIM